MQLVQNAPDDGPMRSETCGANISTELTYSLRPHCVSCWTTYIYIYYKMIHGPYNVEVNSFVAGLNS